MKLGFHVSIAGGVSRAVERARDLGCDTFQFFATNPRGWKLSVLEDAEIARFRTLRDSLTPRLEPVTIHMPYLPNLASVNDELYAKSVASLRENMTRAALLGVEYVVVHMGSYGEGSAEDGLRRMAGALADVLGDRRGGARILLENTAGMGKNPPYGFADIGRVIRAVRKPSRVGLCLDTCHAFAAGHDVTSRKGLDALLGEIDRHIGLDRLHLLHLNDSLKPLGSRLDRHEAIGEGHIGSKGFRLIVNHPALRGIPGIMETPRDSDDDDRANMARMRSYETRRSPAAGRKR